MNENNHSQSSGEVNRLPCAQEKFINIVRTLEIEEKVKFLEWIKWNWMQDAEPIEHDNAPSDILKAIASDVRENLPPSATLPSEDIRSHGDSIGDVNHALHVDSFLYDDDLVDELCDEGKLDRNYCIQCGSHKTKPLTFVSHSLSTDQLHYIFTAILPPLEGKIILDVGSRLGGVLYGAFLYTKAVKVVGIEINSDFCKLQREIVKKYGFQERIEVVEGNVLDRSDVLLAADVIILNNVFECFMTPEKQVDIWKYLQQVIRKGTLVVTIPPIEKVFAIKETGIDIFSWLREIPFFNSDAVGIPESTIETTDVKLYEVM